jgi:hypothetical protein
MQSRASSPPYELERVLIRVLLHIQAPLRPGRDRRRLAPTPAEPGLGPVCLVPSDGKIVVHIADRSIVVEVA